MLRRSFLASAVAVGACASVVDTTPANARDVALEARLDAFFGPYVEARDFSGVIMLARGGSLIAQRSYGAADFDTGAPNTPDTKYACASIGKMFTRAAIVALEREGSLSQADTFARYMPDYPNAANFTVRQLVEHTAGISRDLSFGADVTRRFTQEEIVRRVAAMPVAGAPGERAVYSNNGYRLLGYVIERAGGGDYGAIVRETVFEPRNMRNTGEAPLGASVERMAKGYVAGPGLRTLEPAAADEQLNHRGAGSFYSTPNDLLTFARTLPIEPRDLEAPVRDGARRRLGHNGLGHGFSSLCYKYPNENAELIVMSNIQTGIFTPMDTSLQQFLMNETVTPLPQPPRQAAPLDIARAQAFIGNYELFPGTPLIVRVEGATMQVSAGGDAFAPLTPLGGDRFFMRQRYATLTFNVTDGRAASVLWAEPGGEFNLPRLPN